MLFMVFMTLIIKPIKTLNCGATSLLLGMPAYLKIEQNGDKVTLTWHMK
ncbi:hypothetical protein VPAL9027_00511 [Vibrio palustris]|uniref:Uncharacterized protein n=1 Tax=Vibrio palustris TaxID=1918946 RepID=A0A1R4B0Z6_9VIBR|nr:hypothetical protein VPAL9027_00511 [Vibrio palustris]